MLKTVNSVIQSSPHVASVKRIAYVLGTSGSTNWRSGGGGKQGSHKKMNVRKKTEKLTRFQNTKMISILRPSVNQAELRPKRRMGKKRSMDCITVTQNVGEKIDLINISSPVNYFHRSQTYNNFKDQKTIVMGNPETNNSYASWDPTNVDSSIKSLNSGDLTTSTLSNTRLKQNRTMYFMQESLMPRVNVNPEARCEANAFDLSFWENDPSSFCDKSPIPWPTHIDETYGRKTRKLSKEPICSKRNIYKQFNAVEVNNNFRNERKYYIDDMDSLDGYKPALLVGPDLWENVEISPNDLDHTYGFIDPDPWDYPITIDEVPEDYNRRPIKFLNNEPKKDQVIVVDLMPGVKPDKIALELETNDNKNNSRYEVKLNPADTLHVIALDMEPTERQSQQSLYICIVPGKES